MCWPKSYRWMKLRVKGERPAAPTSNKGSAYHTLTDGMAPAIRRLPRKGEVLPKNLPYYTRQEKRLPSNIHQQSVEVTIAVQ
jgi:hypothetical protein